MLESVVRELERARASLEASDPLRARLEDLIIDADEELMCPSVILSDRQIAVRKAISRGLINQLLLLTRRLLEGDECRPGRLQATLSLCAALTEVLAGLLADERVSQEDAACLCGRPEVADLFAEPDDRTFSPAPRCAQRTRIRRLKRDLERVVEIWFTSELPRLPEPWYTGYTSAHDLFRWCVLWVALQRMSVRLRLCLEWPR